MSKKCGNVFRQTEVEQQGEGSSKKVTRREAQGAEGGIVGKKSVYFLSSGTTGGGKSAVPLEAK